MSALTNTVNYSRTSVACVTEPKFVLPDTLVATLGNGGKDEIKSTTPPAAPISPSETVAPKIPADAGSAEVVSNADFIAAIFGSMPEGASALVCSKPGDPNTGSWAAKPATQVETACLAHLNNYFNCSSVYADTDGKFNAKKENAESYRCLVLDDVGTKADRTLLRDFKASWVLETSPGNFQVGYILAQPLTNAGEVTALQDAVIAAGLCDPGANGMTRWMRLPKGINGKEQYRSAGGQPFQCVLKKWRPNVRYTVDEIIAGLTLVMALAPTPVQHGTRDTVKLKAQTRGIDPADVAKLPALLAAIDPDCGRSDWVRALMAVYHTTGGSDDGFALVDAWSSKGKKYLGIKDLEIQWRSFSGDVQRPVTIGTLIKMARDAGAELDAILTGSEDFESVETEVVRPAIASRSKAADHINPLAKFSLRGRTQELELQMVEQKAILGNIILQGQASVIYAPPNTGKTLIVLHLIIESIKNGRIDPSRLFYLNMDDNSSGLVGKNRWTDEYAFHMLADGHQGFRAAEFELAVETMIADGTAKGVVIILDTLKKFVNPMIKNACRAFTKMARRFALKGGTFIALSHANKNRSANGKIIYAGTSDIVDDFDSAYTLDIVEQQGDSSQRVVEFSNFKNRGGGVALSAGYSYSLDRDLSYNELLLSVREVDPAQLVPIKQGADLHAALESDALIIDAIEACIAGGVNTKMKLVDAAAKQATISQRAALKVIEKYTGNDPSIHHWAFVVRDRGAKVFELLVRPTAPSPAVLETPAQLPVDHAPAQQRARLPEPAVAAALTQDEQFHMDIAREAMELYGDAGGAEDQAHDEF